MHASSVTNNRSPPTHAHLQPVCHNLGLEAAAKQPNDAVLGDDLLWQGRAHGQPVIRSINKPMKHPHPCDHLLWQGKAVRGNAQ